MFVCEKCQRERSIPIPDYQWFMPSFGPCEICGTPAPCADYHGHIPEKPAPASGEEE